MFRMNLGREERWKDEERKKVRRKERMKEKKRIEGKGKYNGMCVSGLTTFVYILFS